MLFLRIWTFFNHFFYCDYIIRGKTRRKGSMFVSLFVTYFGLIAREQITFSDKARTWTQPHRAIYSFWHRKSRLPPGSHCCFVPTVQCSICLLFIFSTVSRLMLLSSCHCNSSFRLRRILFFTPRGTLVAFSTRVNLCVTHNFYPAPLWEIFSTFWTLFSMFASPRAFRAGSTFF